MMTMIEEEFVQAFQETLARYSSQFLLWCVLLELLASPSLDPALYKDVSSFIHVKRRNGTAIYAIVNTMITELSVYVVTSDFDVLMKILAKSLWYWDRCLTFDKAGNQGIRDACLRVLFYHSPTFITSDKGLMTRLVLKVPILLPFMPWELTHDYDLAIAAFSGTRESANEILSYKDGALFSRELLIDLLDTMSEKMDKFYAFHDGFLIAFVSKSSSANAKMLRHILGLGNETNIAIKTKIADFVGVPMGAELQKLKRAHDNLFNLRRLFENAPHWRNRDEMVPPLTPICLRASSR